MGQPLIPNADADLITFAATPADLSCTPLGNGLNALKWDRAE